MTTAMTILQLLSDHGPSPLATHILTLEAPSKGRRQRYTAVNIIRPISRRHGHRSAAHSFNVSYVHALLSDSIMTDSNHVLYCLRDAVQYTTSNHS